MSGSVIPTKKRKRLTAPRVEIAWYPTIDTASCNGCGDCEALCKPGVFEFGPPDPDQSVVLRPKMTVVRPFNCMVLCSRCLPVCPSGAITLPSAEAFERFVEYVD